MLLARQTLLRAVRYAGTLAPDYSSKIGSREVVGYGQNGQPTYIDKVDFPFPAVRFLPDTHDLKALKEKEKGDWKNLTTAEKKALYRASFCQTFSEINAPTGEWKSVVGWGLVFVSLGLWLHMFVLKFVYDESTLPPTLSEERRSAQLKRMLAFRIEPIDGLSSKFDFEKNEWKK